jgi:hypothetical protein
MRSVSVKHDNYLSGFNARCFRRCKYGEMIDEMALITNSSIR